MMIPKITHDVPFLFPTPIIIQILKYTLIKVPKLLTFTKNAITRGIYILNDVSITIKPNKITAKYNDHAVHSLNNKIIKVQIFCSKEWLQVMYVLNNISETVKQLILHTLTLFPTKLLLIIHVLMTISHIDINLSLLRTFFNPNNFGYSYNIHT